MRRTSNELAALRDVEIAKEAYDMHGDAIKTAILSFFDKEKLIDKRDILLNLNNFNAGAVMMALEMLKVGGKIIEVSKNSGRRVFYKLIK